MDPVPRARMQPGNITLTETGDVRIGNFYSACEVEDAATHQPYRNVLDKPEYRAPEESFGFASDIFSVGVMLFEMATGELPSADRDVSIIEDPAKRELISFALHDEPSTRPTAEDLHQMVSFLSPSSEMERQFRAQVFASMRFNDDGPSADGGPPSVTSEGCSYSGTWSWVKPVSIPESPPLGLYDTVPVQLCRQLHDIGRCEMLRIAILQLPGGSTTELGSVAVRSSFGLRTARDR